MNVETHPAPPGDPYLHADFAVATDVVLFTVRQDRLQLLLIRRRHPPFRDCWALPGGFVAADENLDHCAARELREETGIDSAYLEQLYTFSRPDRDPRRRVISTAYYALLPARQLHPRAASDASACGWFRCDRLPPLAFDHADIIAMARDRLYAKLDYSTIAFQLLEPTFTLGEAQRVHEIILGRRLDKRNFRRRMLASTCLHDTGESVRNGHRPARLYALRQPGTVEYVK